MELDTFGNLIEAALWFAISLVLVLKATRSKGQLRLVFLILSFAFLVFGVTDVIEIRTGAWWNPLWLLLLKALCVAGFVLGFGRYYTIMRRKEHDPEKTASN